MPTVIHIRGVSREDVCTQTHVFWSILLEIHQKIPIWHCSCILKSFLYIFDVSWIHLLGQMSDLGSIPGVLEQDHVLGVQADGSVLLVFVEQVLNNVDHADVSMMASLCKQFGDTSISLCHQIVHDHQRSHGWVQCLHIREAFHKLHTLDGSIQVLSFPITPHDMFRWWDDHGLDMGKESADKV